jgi:hypothetical protein
MTEADRRAAGKGYPSEQYASDLDSSGVLASAEVHDIAVAIRCDPGLERMHHG